MERPPRDELANALTHGLGSLLAVAASVWMIARAGATGNWPLIVACTAYGFSLAGVFFSSAMSHWIMDAAGRTVFRRLDQGFIYLLIVATYTPFSLVYLPGWWWATILITMWLIALAGFASKVLLAHRVDRVSVIGYIALGWLPALGGVTAAANVPPEALWGIVGGGVLYTIGTWFLFHDRRRWFYHAVWHVFVVAAAAVHFATTMTWVIGR